MQQYVASKFIIYPRLLLIINYYLSICVYEQHPRLDGYQLNTAITVVLLLDST